ncbi:MAG: hypothetical protein R3C44_19560 [Chloroflexota bacterium]
MSGNEECQAHQLHNSIINGRRLTCGRFVYRQFTALSRRLKEDGLLENLLSTSLML